MVVLQPAGGFGFWYGASGWSRMAGSFSTVVAVVGDGGGGLVVLLGEDVDKAAADVVVVELACSAGGVTGDS